MTQSMLAHNRAVFLDRDGTINEDRHYLYKIEDFAFLPGVVEALRLLQEAGFLLIVVTNQSGIGRGYYTEADFQKLNTWMLSELKHQGITVAATYYCPHLPDAKIPQYRKDCDCRKPRTNRPATELRRRRQTARLRNLLGHRMPGLSDSAQ